MGLYRKKPSVRVFARTSVRFNTIPQNQSNAEYYGDLSFQTWQECLVRSSAEVKCSFSSGITYLHMYESLAY